MSKLNSDLQLTPAAVEFLNLQEMAGWNDAETARQLKISGAAVGKIRSGENNPRGTTLKLLRILADPSLAPPPAYAVGLIQALKAIHPRQREHAVRSALAVISSFTESMLPVPTQPISLAPGVASVALQGQADAARLAQVSLPTPAAAAPSAHTPTPKPAADRKKKTPLAPQEQAPS